MWGFGEFFFMKLSVNLVLYETQSRTESNANFPQKKFKRPRSKKILKV